jgi:AcrR family transcriptional regulator
MSILSEHECLTSPENGSAAELAVGPAPPRPDGTRKLRLKARAERMGETRKRIARATYELHASVGPARTTISAIAERAGVQRLTVYKHYPNDRDIIHACTTYHWELDPPPDPASWREIADPEQRLRQGLGEIYAYFRRNESLFANVGRDIGVVLEQLEGVPPLGLQRFMELPARWQSALVDAWPDDQDRLRGAALGLAVDFATWHTLTTFQQLDDAQVVELMAALVMCATAAPR